MKKRTATLEGVWTYVSVHDNGKPVGQEELRDATLAIEGDQFRAESPEGSYAGTYEIDTSVEPHHIDIDFKDGAATGKRRGIFELADDRLTICFGSEGRERPKAFASKAGSGHTLEVLKRSSKRAGAAKASAAEASAAVGGSSSALGARDPELPKLQGSWAMLAGDRDGRPLPASFLNGAKRIAKGDETTVYLGGRVFLKARVRIDSRQTPKQIDYLLEKGKIQLGIYKLEAERLTFCFAKPGAARPQDFASGKARTISVWRYEGSV